MIAYCGRLLRAHSRSRVSLRATRATHASPSVAHALRAHAGPGFGPEARALEEEHLRRGRAYVSASLLHTSSAASFAVCIRPHRVSESWWEGRKIEINIRLDFR
jgi:hypothetical protein